MITGARQAELRLESTTGMRPGACGAGTSPVAVRAHRRTRPNLPKRWRHYTVTRAPSARAKRLWQRLIEWYGTRIIEQYGAQPPDDWCQVIDEADNDTVKRGLSVIRSRYVQHPPTYPQFEQAFRPGVTAPTGPGPADRLCAHIMRTFGARLTAKQVRGPWTYIGTPAGEISGVVIDADGVSAGYRVMLADIEAPTWLDAQAAAAQGKRLEQASR